MNLKLAGQACAKFAEGFSLLSEALDQSEEQTVSASPAQKTAPKAAKKSKKVEVEEVEETEEVEVEDEETEDEETEGGEDEEEGELEDLEEDDPAPAPKKAKPSREKIRKDIVAYAKKHGKTKAYSLLEKFKVKKVEDVKDADLEKLAALIAKGLK